MCVNTTFYYKRNSWKKNNRVVPKGWVKPFNFKHMTINTDKLIQIPFKSFKDVDGSGTVVELYDNAISKTIRYYVTKSGTLHLSPIKTSIVINALVHYLFYKDLIFKDYGAVNLLFFADTLFFKVPLIEARNLCSMETDISGTVRVYIPRTSLMKYVLKRK